MTYAESYRIVKAIKRAKRDGLAVADAEPRLALGISRDDFAAVWANLLRRLA